MDLGIAGRHAIVFGGSRGMGRACAQQLASEGVNVVIAARTESVLAEAAQAMTAATGTQVRHVAADITTDAGREAVLAACPAPDILVNNADGVLPGDFRNWTQADWHGALDAMALGPIDMIRRVVDGMMERRFGRIVNIVSRSVKTPQLELGLSNGARSCLVGFVAGLARQTVRHNVTINNLLPGVFATDAQRRHIEGMLEPGGKSFDELWEERGTNNPAGRYGQAHEIGALCAFICAAQAGYICGQSILIDGGAYPGTY
ncbi:oxidoreductase [Bordetella trematum]|uniref:Oxidoreductase n=1 Tax=Bordetella trematum TaxID=123899 RepID=A0A157P7T2_9BORD|nr:SDR family oxidoreductase [Bordetella trematum]AUL45963.1 oxidoreductase [Bordetella trematum]AZR92707.1 oxidoreductase [Bordetella trematum]NNH18092.1 SDR family oxidoreductase [Bordetella trematum]QIM71311.1 SDR family oxidoreductase [Bordetella trematum]SAI29376.1 oxidoreductase [Bordetella trematum]